MRNTKHIVVVLLMISPKLLDLSIASILKSHHGTFTAIRILYG